MKDWETMGSDKFLCGLARDHAASVLPMAAIGILVSAALVGGGLDMSRAYRVKNRLQAACDAGVLAGRKNVASNGYDTSAETQAENYFTTNFDETVQNAHDTLFQTTSSDNGNTVEGTASTKLDMTVMKIFGFNDFSLAVDCTASMGVGNSDVVMVLDTTGSMAWTAAGGYAGYGDTSRIEDLQAAMKNFYDTLKTATSGTNSRIRYGFVPYSQTVNVGKLIYDVDPNYLVDSHDYQSRQAIYVEWGASTPGDSGYSPESGWSGWSRMSYSNYGTLSSCESALPANDTDYQDYGTSTTTATTTTDGSGNPVQETTVSQTQRMYEYQCSWNRGAYRKYSQYKERTYDTSETATGTYNTTGAGTFDHWEYKQITYDVSDFKAGTSVTTLTGGNDYRNYGNWVSGPATNVTSTWNGCIEERETVNSATFSYSSLLGITPSGAYDLDIDTAPSYGDDATKWAPMWPEIAYYRVNDSGSRVNDAVTEHGSTPSKVCPHEAQLLAEMSETDFDAYADSLSASGNTYHDIGLVWGARLSSPDGIFASNVDDPPANGGKVARHIIFMTDGEMCPNFTALSAYGIEYHDRRITDDGGNNCGSTYADRHSSRFLALCKAVKAKGIRLWVIAFGTSLTTNLQTCASNNSSYTASDATQLNTAFQEIAKQVGELRLTQ